MNKLETNMAALSRYIELKSKDYYGFEYDKHSYPYRLSMLPEHADTGAFLIMLEHIQKNGVDEFVRKIYDEPFEYWTHAPVIRSYKIETRLKKSVWHSYYERMGLNIIENDFEELVRMFSPLSSYVNKYVRLEIDYFDVAFALLQLPKFKSYRKQSLDYNNVKKLSLYDLERATEHLSNAGGIETLVKNIDK